PPLPRLPRAGRLGPDDGSLPQRAAVDPVRDLRRDLRELVTLALDRCRQGAAGLAPDRVVGPVRQEPAHGIAPTSDPGRAFPRYPGNSPRTRAPVGSVRSATSSSHDESFGIVARAALDEGSSGPPGRIATDTDTS